MTPALHTRVQTTCDEAGGDLTGACEGVIMDRNEDFGMALAEDPPDLLFLDLGTAGGSATEVVARLHGDPDTADLPVIVVAENYHLDLASL